MVDITRIAIIGAGPGGICAARQLHNNKYNKVFDIVVFERQDQVGGLWVYNKHDPYARKKSPIYKDMITNLPKQVSYFPDFPYPEDYPSFLHHALVLKHLQKYAEDIQQFVRFETEVIKVSPLLQNGKTVLNGAPGFIKWQVESKDLKSEQVQIEEFDAVIICSGINDTAFSPSINGLEDFKGKILHSSELNELTVFKNKTVLIYGSNISATDFTALLWNTCKQIYISKRSAGTIEADHPQNVTIVGDVDMINQNGDLEMVDGSIISADVLIFCTGYISKYSFLSRECHVHFEENGKVLTPIYRHVFNINYPSMAIFSLAKQTTGLSTTYYQCNWVTSVFSGSIRLPNKDAMFHDEKQEKIHNQNLGRAHKYFHLLRPEIFKYLNMLADEAETQRLPENVKIIHDKVMNDFKKDFYTAKQKKY